MNENGGTITGAILGLVGSTISLAIAFGVAIRPELRDAIIAEATAVLAIAPLVGALFDHGKRQASSRVAAAAIASSSEAPPAPPAAAGTPAGVP